MVEYCRKTRDAGDRTVGLARVKLRDVLYPDGAHAHIDSNSWYYNNRGYALSNPDFNSQRTLWVRVSDLQELAGKIAKQAILKSTDDIYSDIKNTLLDGTTIIFAVRTYDDKRWEGNKYVITGKVCYMERLFMETEYDTDEWDALQDGTVDDLPEQVRESVKKLYNNTVIEPRWDYHHSLKCDIDMDKMLDSIIKKTVSTTLRYCVRSKKNIMPQEYRDKGDSGIAEWQRVCESKNKNNSMEKKMLREIVNGKYSLAFDILDTIYRDMQDSQLNHPTDTGMLGYTVPRITIDGRWNISRRNKAVRAIIFHDKTPADIVEMTDEDILNKCKQHWLNELKYIQEAVANVKLKNK